MAVDTDVVASMLAEVVNGTPPESSPIPATPANNKLRAALTADVAKLKKDHPKWGVDIPKEWPEVQVPAPVARE